MILEPSPDRERIPFVDLPAQHAPLEAAILQEVRLGLRRSDFVLGEAVQSFERDFARYCGTAVAVGVGSGSDALMLLLRALGLDRPDQEVIVPALTFIATASAVVHAGARPVLADVEPGTLTLDPGGVERALSPRTAAIMAVHLYGMPADLGALRDIAHRRGIPLIEDAAQAHGAEFAGARVGSLGIAAAFSFYPSKNLGACGDGGAVVTGDERLAARIRMLRDHGSPRKYRHDCVGYNSRLDTLQAAILSLKLPLLDGWNEKRRAHAEAYRRRLSGVRGLDLLARPAGRKPVDHLMVVKVPPDSRERLSARLTEERISHGFHYPEPVHRTEAFSFLGHRPGDFPVAEEASRRVISLPMYPELSEERIERVCSCISKFVGSGSSP